MDLDLDSVVRLCGLGLSHGSYVGAYSALCSKSQNYNSQQSQSLRQLSQQKNHSNNSWTVCLAIEKQNCSGQNIGTLPSSAW